MSDFFIFVETNSNTIMAISEALAVIIAVIAIPLSISANIKAKKANKIADKSNDLSSKANIIATEANKISFESCKFSQASTLSRFIIEIQLLGIENDSIYANDFEAFLQQSRISIVFRVNNISQNRAIFADFESNDKKEKLRASGIIIDPDDTKRIRYSLSTQKFIDREPEEISNNRRTYKDTVYLHWDNGIMSCCCSVNYEFTIEKDNNDGQQQFRVKTYNSSCKIGPYSFISFEQ